MTSSTVSGRAPADSARPHVVLIGGGFAGLAAARELAAAPVRLTIVDRRNHHLFQPLLYQVATAALNPSDIAAPIRSVVRARKNTTVLLGEVTSIDPSGRRLRVDGRDLGYDFLIVASGAGDSYFGHDEWRPHAPGLKTVDDALEIRRRVLLAFERAEWETNAAARRELLTFVVVGGGPTGVELAGALSEIARHSLVRDFRDIDPAQAAVVLVEAAERVLPGFPPELSAKAARQLESLGVTIRTGARVTKIDEEAVWLGTERIGARTALWAAGVAASPLGRSLGVPLDRQGRVRVEPDLSVPGHPEIFVAGDLAAVEQEGRPVPGLAPAAMQEGRHAARSIRRRIAGRPTIPFHYVDKGTLATIGRSAAVADIRGWKISGFFAWAAWLGIHIFFLIGFRNRLLVMFEWAWAYLTWQRGARLITGREADAGGTDRPPNG
ncbi:MAG TPA: NAD(P)/FAD-dependent oxidoreductase [Thermoanaerobaculia bacterium]|nr:NAD(P)/FAD-dependent oxidoreductase [Thermoanaerobaculia bacterium]